MSRVNVRFEPGCFDEFEGSQEELDQLIEAINQAAEELVQELAGASPEEIRCMIEAMRQDQDEPPARVLH